jgi:hypothetical protein
MRDIFPSVKRGLAALLGCLLGCSASPPSRFISGPGWDGGLIVPQPLGDVALLGPVLRLRGGGAEDVISRRCVLLADGHWQKRPEYWEEVPHPDLMPEFWLDEVVTDEPCRRAFGAGFRLPTYDEARLALVGPQQALSMLARDGEGKARRLGVKIWNGGFDVTWQVGDTGDLFCVGPPSAAPPSFPTQQELDACVTQLANFHRRGLLEAPTLLTPRSLPSARLARRACEDGSEASYRQLISELRPVGESESVLAAAQRISSQLSEVERRYREARAVIAASGQSDLARGADCDELPDRHRRLCGTLPPNESCVALQAHYASQCLNQDPMPLVASAANELEQRSSELGREASSRAEPALLARLVLECAAKAPLSAAFRRELEAALGAPGDLAEPRGFHRACGCGIEDLACGLNGLTDPTRCPLIRDGL